MRNLSVSFFNSAFFFHLFFCCWEPSVLDDVRRGDYAGLFHSEFLVNAKEDAANNFARGHYTVGKEIMEIVNDRLRKMVDNSENVQGFIV